AADPEISDRWFDVDLTTHQAIAFGAPYDAHEVGYAGDEIVAFTLAEFPNSTGSVTYLGHTLHFSAVTEGIPAAAVAHRRAAAGRSVACGYAPRARGPRPVPVRRGLEQRCQCEAVRSRRAAPRLHGAVRGPRDDAVAAMTCTVAVLLLGLCGIAPADNGVAWE